jgi:hypothetical protein
MSVVTIKAGVEFTTIAPGGFAILGALQQAAEVTGIPIVITSACDGEHSGPGDPHHRGEAYDVRTHDMDSTDKNFILGIVMGQLGRDKFFGFLEDENTANEHLHFQVRKGTIYP